MPDEAPNLQTVQDHVNIDGIDGSLEIFRLVDVGKSSAAREFSDEAAMLLQNEQTRAQGVPAQQWHDGSAEVMRDLVHGCSRKLHQEASDILVFGGFLFVFVSKSRVSWIGVSEQGFSYLGETSEMVLDDVQREQVFRRHCLSSACLLWEEALSANLYVVDPCVWSLCGPDESSMRRGSLERTDTSSRVAEVVLHLSARSRR